MLGALAVFASASACGARDPLADLEARDASPAPPPPHNPCGGDAVLPGAPGDFCGACGRYACVGTDALRCDELGARNACGTCGPVPEEVCNGRDDDCDGVSDEGCVQRLSTLRTNDVRARISGDRVVLDTIATNGNADVLLATLSTGALTVLTPHADPPDAHGDPSYDSDGTIDGARVAWVSFTTSAMGSAQRFQLVLHDLGTNTERVLYERTDAPIAAPVIDGTRVVFQTGNIYADADLWVADLTTGEARALVTGPTNDMAPDLDSDWLVFQRVTGREPNDPRRDVIARNLRTGNEQILSAALAGSAGPPAISGTRVVWHQMPGTASYPYTGEVYVYDLATRSARRLGPAMGETAALTPRIAGDLVCWSRTFEIRRDTGVYGDGGMSVHSLATGRTRLLTPRGLLCDVDGRAVVTIEQDVPLHGYVRVLLPEEP